MAVVRELARYKLGLVGVQEVRWDIGGTARAVDYTFFYGKGNENYLLGSGFFMNQRIIQQLREKNLLGILYIVLRGCCYNCSECTCTD